LTNNPYRQYLKQIIESSGKAPRLDEIFERFSGQKDAEGKWSRGIIGSAHFASTAIIYFVSSILHVLLDIYN